MIAMTVPLSFMRAPALSSIEFVDVRRGAVVVSADTNVSKTLIDTANIATYATAKFAESLGNIAAVPAPVPGVVVRVTRLILTLVRPTTD